MFLTDMKLAFSKVLTYIFIYKIHSETDLKALKILATGFLIFIAHLGFSEDLVHLMADINAIKTHINKNPRSSPVLSSSFEKLQDHLPGLKNCVKEQDNEIKQINSSLEVLKDTQTNPQLILKQELELKHFKQASDQKIFCNYLIMDIEKTIATIKKQFNQIYKESYTKKYPNIIEAFSHGVQLTKSSVNIDRFLENLHQREKLFKVEKSVVFKKLCHLFNLL
jgi:hypothetical protein